MNLNRRLTDNSNLLAKYGLTYFEGNGIKIRALDNLAHFSIETEKQKIISGQKCSFNINGKYFLMKPIYLDLALESYKGSLTRLQATILLESSVDDDTLEEIGLWGDYLNKYHPSIDYRDTRRYLKCFYDVCNVNTPSSHIGQNILDIVTETKIKLNQLV